MPDGSDAARRLEQLRGWRARPEPELAVGPLIAARLADARRAQKQLGSFVELWESVLPDELALHTRVTGLRSGVVHVTVDTSATAYELDRCLREGVEQQMRRAFGKTLLRVRITVGRVG
ncbi:MAG: DUF721 domain-containing protein [Planctomycetes bacterium]|nr:DUF721 domain-containing protein [Planctomycetota bacterium]